VRIDSHPRRHEQWWRSAAEFGDGGTQFRLAPAARRDAKAPQSLLYRLRQLRVTQRIVLIKSVVGHACPRRLASPGDDKAAL
jgi:hypothetical protein